MFKSLIFSLSFLLIFFPPKHIFSQLLPISPPIIYSDTQGEWNLLHASIGISAMHMQLLHNNKVIIFDRTDFGPSNLSLPGGRCRYDPVDTVLQNDCTAHSVLYDVGTNQYRPLTIQTDTWCSSGAVLQNGTLVQTGGFNDGDHVVRTFSPCIDDSCDWTEFPNYLSERRWYATNQILPDGRVIIVGGRRQFSYEFYPRNPQASSSSSNSQSFDLRFLLDTRDYNENNLYPFLHLLPDGNLFIFANTRSIVFDYKQNRVIKEFPQIDGGDPRNYPSSGSSVLLPLDENTSGGGGDVVEAEVMVCGGAPRSSYGHAVNNVFERALSTCGRLVVVGHANPSWFMENMPLPRVMGDMLILPTGDVIIINGAESGTSGWELGRDPVTRPIIYRPSSEVVGQRYSIMAPSPRSRLYHSSAILLTDGRVLVGGSNPHVYYNFTDVMYPTDLSLESFSPPYLSAEYVAVRPKIVAVNETLGYGDTFTVSFTVSEYLSWREVSVRIILPSFTTHSFAMNQRMVVIKTMGVYREASGSYNVVGVGPSTAEIAPPGYYLLFVVHSGTPSSGMWVKIS
ncbi:hypothetical protein Ddye_025423 [Dipteronia dyeriana]|uniref:Galactose oxidase n=1 Tax=Dipteronia dyeriana TaxID=168575 RepID=A0AAD9TL58_9ROSI|nr:hypothetical protein Ddye_025423 [Dipteronia dyeriana]